MINPTNGFSRIPPETNIESSLNAEKKQKFLQNLLSAAKHSLTVQKLTNSELADYLINNTWAKTDFDTEENAILAEIIERLKRFS